MRNSQGLSMIQQGDLVRTLLVRARIFKQEAVVVREAYNNLQSDAMIRRTVTGLRQEAFQLRMEARVAMKAIEVENGRRYVKGQSTVPLSFLVGGGGFKDWECYREMYDAHNLFRGVDPN